MDGMKDVRSGGFQKKAKGKGLSHGCIMYISFYYISCYEESLVSDSGQTRL